MSADETELNSLRLLPGANLEDVTTPDQFWFRYSGAASLTIEQMAALFEHGGAGKEAIQRLILYLLRLKSSRGRSEAVTPMTRGKTSAPHNPTTPLSSASSTKRRRCVVGDDASVGDDSFDENADTDNTDALFDVSESATRKTAGAVSKVAPAASEAPKSNARFYVTKDGKMHLSTSAVSFLRAAPVAVRVPTFINWFNRSDASIDVNACGAIALRLFGFGALHAPARAFDRMRLAYVAGATKSAELAALAAGDTLELFPHQAMVKELNQRFTQFKAAALDALQKAYTATVADDVKNLVLYLKDKKIVSLAKDEGAAGAFVHVAESHRGIFATILAHIAQRSFEALKPTVTWRAPALAMKRDKNDAVTVSDFNKPMSGTVRGEEVLMALGPLPPLGALPVLVKDDAGTAQLKYVDGAAEGSGCAQGDAMLAMALIAPLLDGTLISEPLPLRVRIGAIACGAQSPKSTMIGLVGDEALRKTYVERQSSNTTTSTKSAATSTTTSSMATNTNLNAPPPPPAPAEKKESLKSKIYRHCAVLQIIINLYADSARADVDQLVAPLVFAVGDCVLLCGLLSASQWLAVEQIALFFGFKKSRRLSAADAMLRLSHTQLAEVVRTTFSRLIDEAQDASFDDRKRIHDLLDERIDGEMDRLEIDQLRQPAAYVEQVFGSKLFSAMIDSLLDGKTTVVSVGVDTDRWPAKEKIQQLLQTKVTLDMLDRKSLLVHDEEEEMEFEIALHPLMQALSATRELPAHTATRTLIIVGGVRYRHSWTIVNQRAINVDLLHIVEDRSAPKIPRRLQTNN